MLRPAGLRSVSSGLGAPSFSAPTAATSRMQAALLLALDQAPAAAAWIEQSLSAAQATGQTVSGLRARRVAAQVEAARRNGAAAEAHLEKAYTQRGRCAVAWKRPKPCSCAPESSQPMGIYLRLRRRPRQPPRFIEAWAPRCAPQFACRWRRRRARVEAESEIRRIEERVGAGSAVMSEQRSCRCPVDSARKRLRSNRCANRCRSPGSETGIGGPLPGRG